MRKKELLTERLQLRLIEPSDVVSIHALHILPETDKFNTLDIPKTIEETALVIAPWIADNQQSEISNYTYALELIPEKQFIGLMALKLGTKKYRRGEVWYKLHPDHWNKGYGTEALNRVLDFGFGTLHLHRIEAGCAVDNIASIKLLERVGMTREGRKRKVLPLKSGWSDNFEYAILETDERRKNTAIRN